MMSRKAKGRKTPLTPDLDGSTNSTAIEKWEARIRELSTKLASLFGEMDELRNKSHHIISDIELTKGPAEYERLRRLLGEVDAQVAVVSKRIERVTMELRGVQAQRREFNTAQVGPLAQLEAEILALDWRLVEVADAQQAAVRTWNENPIPERRAAFDAVRSNLHAEFDRLLKQKLALLKAKNEAMSTKRL